MDVWTAVQGYLDQDATGSLTPETEVNKPEYKVFLGFKKDEVRYANELFHSCILIIPSVITLQKIFRVVRPMNNVSRN